MLGALQWIFAGVRFAANDRGDVEALALATNLLRYEPLVTTVCRYLHAKAPTQLWANVMFGVKSALDLLCPAAAGVITVYQSGYTAGHPLELTTLPSVGPGRVGDTYPEARFGATGGWPPYTWSAEPLLPDGLQLDKSRGVLSGTPRSVETRRFTVQAKDAYGPAASATTPELTIEIT